MKKILLAIGLSFTLMGCNADDSASNCSDKTIYNSKPAGAFTEIDIHTNTCNDIFWIYEYQNEVVMAKLGNISGDYFYVSYKPSSGFWVKEYVNGVETVYPMDNPQSAPSYIQDIWDTANLDAIKAMESHWALYPYH